MFFWFGVNCSFNIIYLHYNFTCLVWLYTEEKNQRANVKCTYVSKVLSVCKPSCIWSSLKSVCGWRELCGKNEVIIAADLCDTRYYLHSCDFTNVSADSMNNTCPYRKMTSSTFFSLICYFLKFTSSLLTHVSVECVFVCAPLLFPRRLLCWLPAILHPVQRVQPSHW